MKIINILKKLILKFIQVIKTRLNFQEFIKTGSEQEQKDLELPESFRKKTVEKKIIWHSLAKWTLLALIFLLPIFFIPGRPNLFFLNQQTLLIFLVLLAVIFWIIGKFSSGKISFLNLYPGIYTLLIIFLAAGFLSLILSPSFYFSLWGVDGSEVGSLLNLFAGVVIFLLICGLFRSKKDFQSAFMVFGISVALSLLLIFLNNIFDFYFHKPFIAIPNHLFNTIGAINAFSVFLGIGFLLALGLAVFQPKRSLKIFGIILSIILFLIIANVNNRAAMAAMAVTLIFGLILWSIDKIKVLHAHLFNFNIILFFALVFLISVFWGYQFINFFQIPIEATPSALTSFKIAGSTLSESIKNLFFGSGPNTFVYDFLRYKPLEINLTPFANTEFSYGFSYWLTLLPSLGILATLSLLIFFALIFIKNLYKFIKAKKDEWENKAAFYLLIISFYLLISSFISPLSLVLVIYIFIVFGFLAASASLIVGAERAPSSFNIDFSKKFFLVSLLSMAVLVGSLFFAISVGKRYAANATIDSILVSYVQNRDTEKAIDKAAYAFNLFPSDYSARLLGQLWFIKLNNDYLQNLNAQALASLRPQIQDAFNKSISVVQKAVDLNPLNYQNWALVGDIYRGMIPIVEGADGYAVSAYKKAQETNPTNSVYPFIIAQLNIFQVERGLIDQNDGLQSAEDNLDESLRLKSDNLDAYVLLAQVYERRGKLNEAISKTQSMLDRFPDNIGLLFQLGYFKYKINDFYGAKNVFIRALNINPNYSNARYLLGLIYEHEGEKDEAIRQFEEILKFNPDNKDVIQRLEQLKRKTK